MPRKNSIDEHPYSEEIKEQLRNGKETYRDMARHYGISRAALSRYRQNLVKEDIARTVSEDGDNMDVVPAEESDNYGDFALNISKDLEEMRGDLKKIRNATIEENPNIAINAIDKQVKLLDSYLKIVEEMREQQKQDISNHPDFIAFRDVVAEVLRKYPDILGEVEQKLEGSNLI